MSRYLLCLTSLAITLSLSACTGIPEGTQAVTNFELDRYLGRWYETARFNHSFEEGLDCVTADYSVRDDGGVKVINRGVNLADSEPDVAEGKAYFIGDENVGRLKVSFFGPFYAGYNVLALDDAYQWSLVSGPDRDYLWILSRTPELPAGIEQQLINKASELGFDTAKLLDVEQGESCRQWRHPESSGS